MLKDCLADIEEEQVKHQSPDARYDKQTMHQASWMQTRRKGSSWLIFPSYATRCSDELDGPFQSIQKMHVRNWLCLAYEAGLVEAFDIILRYWYSYLFIVYFIFFEPLWHDILCVPLLLFHIGIFIYHLTCRYKDWHLSLFPTSWGVSPTIPLPIISLLTLP